MTIRRMAIISTFAALIVVATFINIPVHPVSFTLQTLMIVLAGFVLRPLDAFLAVFVYLLVGLVGIPVFTTGGGPGAFVSATGGFLFGFLFCALGISLLKSKDKNLLIDIPVMLFFGIVVLYTFGIIIFNAVTLTSFENAAFSIFVPYYVWDIAKLIVAYTVYFFIPKDVLDKYLKN